MNERFGLFWNNGSQGHTILNLITNILLFDFAFLIKPVKTEWWVLMGLLAWLSVWARCRFAYGPADATATHCLLLQ